MAIQIQRREFIVTLGSAAIVRPLRAHAQQTSRTRRIGVLMGTIETSPDAVGLKVVIDRLESLGWKQGVTAMLDVFWSRSDINLMRENARALRALSPDVILCHSNPALAQLRPLSENTPIVFVMVADPVGSGFINSLSHPGGNITGFTNFEPSIGGKWAEILKELAPRMMRVGVLMHPETNAHLSFWREAEAAARSLRVKPEALHIHTADQIEHSIATFAAQPDGGLIVLPHTVTEVYRDLIISLASRFGLPSIHAFPAHPAKGALASYGVAVVDHFRPAAEYIHRILLGTKPADLPVQAPTRFELIINLKTAKALGLDVPPTLLARADEVIE